MHFRRLFWTLLVAGGRFLYAAEAKVSVPAPEPGRPPVLELAAGAQPLHLKAVEEEGQAEGVTSVSPRNELERFWYFQNRDENE